MEYRIPGTPRFPLTKASNVRTENLYFVRPQMLNSFLQRFCIEYRIPGTPRFPFTKASHVRTENLYFVRPQMLNPFLHRLCICVCVCVFSSHPFWTSSSLDVPAGVTQEEGHTGFLIHLPSAVRALIFVARRIQPFLSLVDREVEFCVLTN